MKRSEAVKAATNGVSRAWHHSERNSYPGTSPLLTSVINELRKGVRHATLRASVSAYRVVLFLTGSIRSYPPYKVGILRWTHEREHQKPTSSRAWIRRCAPALSCSPQDKHLEAFAFPFELAADFVQFLGCNRCRGVHTREHVCTNTELNHSLCGFEPDHRRDNGRKPT